MTEKAGHRWCPAFLIFFQTLCLMELEVKPFFLKKLLVRAPLGNLAFVEYQNLVSPLDCGKAVSNGNNCLLTRQSADGLLNLFFRVNIYGGSCFVQDDNWGAAKRAASFVSFQSIFIGITPDNRR